MPVKDKRILKLKTVDEMIQILSKNGRPFNSFKAGDKIVVWNKMCKDYTYTLAVDPWTEMDSNFKPYATPAEMLSAGVFEGKYLNDCLLEFPAEWFWNAHDGRDWKDKTGQPVRKVEPLLLNAWAKWREVSQSKKGEYQKWFTPKNDKSLLEKILDGI